MINPMTKYSFVLLNGEQGGLLDDIQELGLVDITREAKPVDDTSRNLSSEIELIDGYITGLKKIVVPEGTQPTRKTSYDIVRLAGGVLMLYSQTEGEIRQLHRTVSERMAWGSFDSDHIQKLAQAGIPIHFHKLNAKQFREEWDQEYALSVIAREKDGVYFVVAGEDALPGEIPAPADDVSQAREELRLKEQYLSMLQGEVLDLQQHIPELEALKADYCAKLDRHLAGVSAVPAAENTIVTLVGYAPREKEATVTAALDKTGVLYLKEDAGIQDNPPIQFKNNWFVRQFETLTDMYGRPAYDGFDPTPFISIFFLLFFAFCMGDCGYGLVLVLAGLLLKKVDSFKDMAPLVVILGCATVLIGFFFHTFFSIDISKWQVFAPIKGIFLPAQIAGNDATMVLSLVVGVLHICLAMVVKTIHQTKTKGFYASLGTWGWTLLIVGGIIVAAFAFTGVLNATLTKWIVIVLGVVSALGIFVFNDPKRNKFANIGMGLWDTYNMITGLVGDVLSYIRLYALGLAGSMLGMAFNDMGVMILGDSPNIGKWLGFLFLVIFGHTLNIAMCALGAFVHPLRLNFLEFFKNSGYEAAGRNYNPLKK